MYNVLLLKRVKMEGDNVWSTETAKQLWHCSHCFKLLQKQYISNWNDKEKYSLPFYNKINTGSWLSLLPILSQCSQAWLSRWHITLPPALDDIFTLRGLTCDTDANLCTNHSGIWCTNRTVIYHMASDAAVLTPINPPSSSETISSSYVDRGNLIGLFLYVIAATSRNLYQTNPEQILNVMFMRSKNVLAKHPLTFWCFFSSSWKDAVWFWRFRTKKRE